MISQRISAPGVGERAGWRALSLAVACLLVSAELAHGQPALTLDLLEQRCTLGESCDLLCSPSTVDIPAGVKLVTHWQKTRPGGGEDTVVEIVHDDGRAKGEVMAEYKDKLEVVSNDTLRLVSAAPGDEGRYTCTLKTGNEAIYEQVVNVTILKLPGDTRPVIEPSDLKMKATEEKNVTCSFLNAYPAAELTWTKKSGDATFLSQESNTTTNADHTVNTYLTVLVRWGQRSSELVCEVTHPFLPERPTASVGGEPPGGWILPVVIIVLLLIAAGIIAILLILYRRRTQGQADYKVNVPAQSAEEGRELKDMSKKGGLTGLLEAAKSGDADQTVKILEKQPTVTNQQDEEGWTALHWAAAYGHSDVVRALLDKKATTSVQNKAGETAEDLATSHKHHDIVTMLQDAKTAEEERLAEA